MLGNRFQQSDSDWDLTCQDQFTGHTQYIVSSVAVKNEEIPQVVVLGLSQCVHACMCVTFSFGNAPLVSLKLSGTLHCSRSPLAHE